MYDSKKKMKIKLNKNDKIMCAYHRPGHFEGVLAVIKQFLSKLKPKFIFFGEKDYQQLKLVKKYIGKKFRTQIIPCSTVRHKNMYALSSRNILLTNKNLKKLSLIAKLLIKFKKKN